MRNTLYFLCFIAFAGKVAGQSDVQFSHFMFNKFAYNPGYTGSKGAFDALALYRKQWAGFEGAPSTMYLAAHTPFAGFRSGLGLGITSDYIGKANTNALDLSYAYRISLRNAAVLSLGLSGRLEQMRFRWSAAEALEPGDQAIPFVDEASLTPNFGAGAYLRGRNYFVGLSVPRLLKSGLYVDRSEKSFNPLTTYFMGGFMMRINQQLQLLPSMLLSYQEAAPLDVDVNLNLLFMQSFWVGGSYRLGDSVDAMAGMELGNGLRLGVSVDFTTSDLQKVTNGSWEIMMGYTFQCKSCEVSHLRFF